MNTTTTTSSPSPTSNPNDQQQFEVLPLYGIIVVASFVFLSLFQIAMSKWGCLKLCAPKRITEETSRCCWDDGAYRKIEYHPGELEKIKPVGICKQFFHHLLFTSPFMPTDDTFRGLARHHRVACFWAAFATPMLTVTLILDPKSYSTTGTNSNNQTITIVNSNTADQFLDISTYDMLSLILVFASGSFGGFVIIARIFWSLFAGAEKGIVLVPRDAAEREVTRTRMQQARDKRFAIVWILWFLWCFGGCISIMIVFGAFNNMNHSSIIMRHAVLSAATIVVGFFVVDPLFASLLVCCIPKCCSCCSQDANRRLIHPGLFSWKMPLDIHSPFIAVQFEGNANSASGSGSGNNRNTSEGIRIGIEDDEAEAKAGKTRERNESDLCDGDVEFDDELPMDATQEQRVEYVKSKLSTLDQWAELPPQESKEMSAIRVVRSVDENESDNKTALLQSSSRNEVVRTAEGRLLSGGIQPPIIQQNDHQQHQNVASALGTSNNNSQTMTILKHRPPRRRRMKSSARKSSSSPRKSSSSNKNVWSDLDDSDNSSEDSLFNTSTSGKNKKNKKSEAAAELSDDDSLFDDESNESDDSLFGDLSHPKKKDDDDSDHEGPRLGSSSPTKSTKQKSKPLKVISVNPLSTSQQQQLKRTSGIDTKVKSALTAASKALKDCKKLDEIDELRRACDRDAVEAHGHALASAAASGSGEGTSSSSLSSKNPINAMLGTFGGKRQQSHRMENEARLALLEDDQRKEEKRKTALLLGGDDDDDLFGNNDGNDTDECDDEKGAPPKLTLSQQVSILNSRGLESILSNPAKKKNKNDEMYLGGMRLDKKGAFRTGDENDLAFSMSNNNKEREISLSPSPTRIIKQKPKTLEELGGLDDLDLPPVGASIVAINNNSASSSPSHQNNASGVKAPMYEVMSKNTFMPQVQKEELKMIANPWDFL